MTGPDLTTWRKLLGLTKARAALAIGCSSYSLTIWERGGRAIPRYIALACILLAYAVEDSEENSGPNLPAPPL